MSRRLSLDTQEKGRLELLVVWTDQGRWEPEWEPLRGTPWGELVTTVAAGDLEHALRGWSKRFVGSLGLPPAGALRKVPKESRVCLLRDKCPLYKPAKCVPIDKELPWCFEPDGIEDVETRAAAARLIQVWHEGVYVVVTDG